MESCTGWQQYNIFYYLLLVGNNIASGGKKIRLWQLHNDVMVNTPTSVGQYITTTMMDTYISLDRA